MTVGKTYEIACPTCRETDPLLWTNLCFSQIGMRISPETEKEARQRQAEAKQGSPR